MKSIDNLCLKTGDWFLMKYGFDVHKFYIAEICGNMVRLSKKQLARLIWRMVYP